MADTVESKLNEKEMKADEVKYLKLTSNDYNIQFRKY